jgi:hypothetical protein
MEPTVLHSPTNITTKPEVGTFEPCYVRMDSRITVGSRDVCPSDGDTPALCNDAQRELYNCMPITTHKEIEGSVRYNFVKLTYRIAVVIG